MIRSITADDVQAWSAQLTTVEAEVVELAKQFRAKWNAALGPILSGPTLFAPIEHGRRETVQTRALAWILDPKCSGNLGLKCLRALLAATGETKHGKGRHGAPASVRWHSLRSSKVDEVTAEKVMTTGTERVRLDVYARGRVPGAERRQWQLVIEAKIDAPEGVRQLIRIQKQVRQKRIRQTHYLFLTEHGTTPSSVRGHKLGTQAYWHCMSFERAAALLMRQVVNANPRSLDDQGVLTFSRLYIGGLLRDLGGWPAWDAGASANAFEIADLAHQLARKQIRADPEVSPSYTEIAQRCSAKGLGALALALWARHAQAMEYLDLILDDVIEGSTGPWSQLKTLRLSSVPAPVRPLLTKRRVEELVALRAAAYEHANKLVANAAPDLRRNLKGRVSLDTWHKRRIAWMVEAPCRKKGKGSRKKPIWLGMNIDRKVGTSGLWAFAWVHFGSADAARRFDPKLPRMQRMLPDWSPHTVVLKSVKLRPRLRRNLGFNEVEVTKGLRAAWRSKRRIERAASVGL